MSKKYEALVIFSTAVRDDDLEGALGRFADELQKLGATIENTEALGRRTFARTIDKRDTALYGKVRFDAEPGLIDAARERFRLYEDTLRIQFVARNLRIEAAKAKDDARRAAFQAKMAEKAAAAAAAAEAAAEPAPAAGPEA